jgi:hypothetical protein
VRESISYGLSSPPCQKLPTTSALCPDTPVTPSLVDGRAGTIQDVRLDRGQPRGLVVEAVKAIEKDGNVVIELRARVITRA